MKLTVCFLVGLAAIHLSTGLPSVKFDVSTTESWPTTTIPACGHSYHEYSGYIYSPNHPSNYSNNADCYFYLDSMGFGISLQFYDIVTEECCDHITVYEGWSPSGRVLLQVSGNAGSRTASTMETSRLLVHFYSDASITARGFQASFQRLTDPTTQAPVTSTDIPVCGDQYLFTGGYVVSPSYSSNYSNNLDCYWYLDTHMSGIFLRFNTFDTESGYDYVKVYEGRNTSGALLLQHSGSSIPNWIYTNRTGQLLVHFYTDGSVTRPGFHAQFGGYFEETVLTANSGQLTSLNYPSNYYDNMDYRWTIRVSSGTRIRVTFNHFHTETDYDFLTIYDGSTVNSPQILRASGGSSLAAVTSSSNEMLIQFTTDHSVVRTGWSLSYDSF